MEKIITEYPNLKEIEQFVWRKLQETFSMVMTEILSEIDEQIAEERDKQRYRLQEKRTFSVVSLFGEVEIKRNYYRDRKGIDTEGMRSMGSAEGTMSVFAKKLKNGRSWVEK